MVVWLLFNDLHRVKVKDVLNGLKASSELQINNERVEVKCALDLLELECEFNANS